MPAAVKQRGPEDPPRIRYITWAIGAGAGEGSGSGFLMTPTNLVATAVSESEIDLVWVDNSGSEIAYDIERSLDGDTWAVIDTVPADTETYDDFGLEPVTTYYYRVRAIGTVGGSAYSNIASATTLGVPGEAGLQGHLGTANAIWGETFMWGGFVE